MKYHLSLVGKDWNEITDWEMFLDMYKAFEPELTQIIFGDLDFTSFQVMVRKDNDELVLYDRFSDTYIDRSIYEIIVGYIRKCTTLIKM